MYARYTAVVGRGAREGAVRRRATSSRPTSTATTVRVRDGETIVTDGPFAETKEALGGYYLFDCEHARRGARPRRADPGAPSTARSRCGPATSTRRRAGARVAGGRGMKYVLLLNNAQEDRERWALMSEEEAQTARAAEIPKWNALFEELGPLIQLGQELDDPATAKTVRVRDGERLVTDGPYAETKEQIGGIFLIEAEDLDQAISIAAKIPVAERASVEIRPHRPRDRPDSDGRPRLPGGVAARGLAPGPRPRRPRSSPRTRCRTPSRWRSSAGARDGAAREPRRVDRHDGAEPRDRPDPPRAHARAEDASCWPGSRSCGRARRTT